MDHLLKGNFTPKKKIRVPPKGLETLEERFEREALARLGGSICFVSKQKILWDLNKSEHERPA